MALFHIFPRGVGLRSRRGVATFRSLLSLSLSCPSCCEIMRRSPQGADSSRMATRQSPSRPQLRGPSSRAMPCRLGLADDWGARAKAQRRPAAGQPALGLDEKESPVRKQPAEVEKKTKKPRKRRNDVGIKKAPRARLNTDLRGREVVQAHVVTGTPAAMVAMLRPTRPAMGSRLRVNWPQERRFYAGTVGQTALHDGRAATLVYYDDGDVVWHE